MRDNGLKEKKKTKTNHSVYTAHINQFDRKKIDQVCKTNRELNQTFNIM